VQQWETVWTRVAKVDPPKEMGCRQIFAYAMALCEARQHPERLERLFDLAARMQDRDPKSPTCGNLRWRWGDTGVTDGNAVEFTMQDAATIWLRHRDWLPAPARKTLSEVLDRAVDGCLRHRVPVSYTNIALLNAGNLIVLGETLDRPEAAEEGYRRLDAFCLYTWQFGIREYCSPTYTGTDLNGLLFIEANAKRDRGRQQARALLELFWTDIALNWFQAADKLAGPQSRSYDYVRGLGALDCHLVLSGWLDTSTELSELLHAAMFHRPLPAALRTTSIERVPRLVRQSWGVRPWETRTLAMFGDVALGCAGATYGQHDMPLTVDLAGPRSNARCYFIADGREDPYGKSKYETGRAKHPKALHLEPFWAGAQCRRDAVGVVVYRRDDLAGPEVTNLQSHFVLRRDVDGLWLRGRRIELPTGTAEQPGRIDVSAGDPLVLRAGTAAVGIRLLWARRQDGEPATAALVDDGNRFGVARLTVDHRSANKTIEAGAAFWVRIGSGLKDEAAFETWRKRFEETQPTTVEAELRRLQFEVPGEDGRVAMEIFGSGSRGPIELEPRAPRAVLECDGRDLGRAILEKIEPIRSRREGLSLQKPLDVPARRAVYCEAEDGFVLPGMTVAETADASGGRFLWQPPDQTDKTGTSPVLFRAPGTAYYPLRVAEEGLYHLWGRVQAPDPQSDSFYVRINGETEEMVPRAAWNLRPSAAWDWQPVVLDKLQGPVAIRLPAGAVMLEIQTREAGTKLDRLFLTREAGQRPQ
jgi:hypothetical protein